jgi:hypothetical protein
VLFKYGSNENQIVGSLIEVFNHSCLSNLGNTVPHYLKSSEERTDSFTIMSPNGFEIPWLHWLIGEGLEVLDKPAAKISPIVDAMSRQMPKPL